MARLQAGQLYLVDDDFHAEGEGELSVRKGQRVTVLEPEDANNPGWVFCGAGDESGFVPSDFLVADAPAPAPPPALAAPPRPAPAAAAAPPQRMATYGSQGAAPPPAVGAAPAAYGAPAPAAYGAPPPAAYGAPPPAASPYGYKPAAAAPAAAAYPQPVYASTSASAYAAPAAPTASAYAAPAAPASAYGYGGYGAPPAPPQPTAAQRAEEEQRFRAEQRLISLELWQYRDELLGTCVVPDPPRRRWFYRDFFGDIQGPFDMPEMKERLGKQFIRDDSIVVMETGSGDWQAQEEETLRHIFRSPEAAFVENPRPTKVANKTWYFMGRDQVEAGPFTTEQMKGWFDAGYFGGGALVRLANGQTGLTPLKDVYADPDNSFKAPPNLPGGDITAFSGHRTAVLVRQPGMAGQKKPKEEVPDEESERVEAFDEAPTPPLAVATAAAGAGAASDKPNSHERSGTKNPDMVLYGGGFPPYQGVPSPHNLKQNVYSSLLYTFMTRPLHPEAGTVQCYIRRDIDGSHINFNKYVLFLEDTNTPIIAAYRHHHTLHNYYDIKLNTTGKLTDNYRGLTIANLELNFVGTTFLLHNSVQGHQGTPKDLACVTYEKNRMRNKGPRKMKVGVPGIRDDKPEFTEWKHDGIKNSGLINSLKSVSTKDMIPLLNKPPRWNEKKKAYMLDFKGRVTRSSVKNFQLVDAIKDPDHKNVVLQHGRTGVNRFSMDVSHPLSILQAFAICLSSLHSKKEVE